MVAAALFAALTWPVLTWWQWEYTRPDSYYGHALFVPVLAGLMLWSRRGPLRSAGARAAPAVLSILLPLLALLVLAVKMEMQAVMSAALLLSLTCGAWYLMGSRWVRAARVPLLFLWLMAPLPGPVLNDATLGLQRLSTAGAALLLRLLTFPAAQQGNVIHMDNFTLNVDVPCSGFKLLLCLLTFSAAFAYLSDLPRAKRAALLAFALPLSLGVNTLRIALFGVVGECAGVSVANAFHDWDGVISLVICMTALFGAARLLGCRTFAGHQLF